MIKSFLGGYKPFHALIHRNIPVRSIGIEYRPDFFHQILKDNFGPSYVDPKSAFKSIDETEDFPEMKKLLWEIWKYEGSASSAALFYDAKVREALCLIFEHHRKLNEKTKATISSTDTQLLNSLGLYINDHFAELFSNAKGLLPLSYRKAFQKSHF